MPRILFSDMNIECAIRLLVSCMCGAMIGLERARRNKGAGLRTHVIVALGAALFVIVSKYGFTDVPEIEGVKADVARVAANVSSGVGFLGAGIIFMKGDTVQGLTTAAGIWLTAAVGLAVGSGMYTTGIFCSILILILQEVMHREMFAEIENNRSSRIVVCMEEDPVAYGDLKRKFKEQKIEVKGSHIKRRKDGTLTYTFDVRMPRGVQTQDILKLAKDSPNVKSIGI